ncbi:MAG: branched-chain amino acid ABC transporter permease [Stackebrandtia sp.]
MNAALDRFVDRRRIPWIRWWTPLLPVAAAFVPFAVDDFTLSTFARMIALGVLAVSVAVLTGIAGLPTLGQVAPYAVGAYTTARLAEAGVTVGPVQLLAAAAAAAGFSAVVGLFVVRTRGVVFLMVTLAVGELTAVAAKRWTVATGGTDGMARIPATEPFWGAEPLIDDWHIYWYVLAVATLVVAAAALLLRAAPGDLIRGVRDNEKRMRASGHRVTRYLFTMYVATGAVAGVGGSLFVTSQRYLSPSDVGFTVSALILIAVVIGGAASLGGALAGVVLIISARDWADAEFPGQGPLLLGLVFIACVYLLPDGLSGLPKRVRILWTARRRTEASA